MNRKYAMTKIAAGDYLLADNDARQAELLEELEGLTRRASIGHDGVWENERRRVIHLELSAIDAGIGRVTVIR